jgi:dihydroneopterin aldolase
LFTIHLQNCRFYGYHGIYHEESVIGNELEVNLSASFESDEPITSIHETINYVAVYEIVKRHLERPRQLLETISQEIADDIFNLDNKVKSIEIHLSKLNPPIKNFKGNVCVSYTKRY